MFDKKKGQIVFGIVIAVALIIGALNFVSLTHQQDFIEESVPDFPLSEPIEIENEDSDFFDNLNIIKNFKERKQNFIAVIRVEGTIAQDAEDYNQRWIIETIKSLARAENNKAIVLFINSPGGGVYEADEVYTLLSRYKQTGKKVYAYFGSLAASGGYYIACAADKIFANRNTITGSIGVISASGIDATALMEKIGIKSTTITAGRNKNMFNFDSPVTEEQKNIMQNVADEAYDQFTQIVADSRAMSIEEVRSIADGRIYTARQALENGLIDEICTWDEAKTAISRQSETYPDIIFKTYAYEEKYSVLDLLTDIRALIKSPSALIPSPSLPMYLYTNLSDLTASSYVD